MKNQFPACFRPIWPNFGPIIIFSGKLVTLAAKHYVSLQSCAKSKKTDEVNSRKWPKTPFLAHWVQFWSVLGTLGPISERDFFSKTGLCTFLGLLKGNFVKNQKNLMMGSIRTFVTDRQSRIHKTRCPSRRVLKVLFFDILF